MESLFSPDQRYSVDTFNRTMPETSSVDDSTKRVQVHKTLKNFKQGNIKIEQRGQPVNVSWSEEEKRFYPKDSAAASLANKMTSSSSQQKLDSTTALLASATINSFSKQGGAPAGATSLSALPASSVWGKKPSSSASTEKISTSSTITTPAKAQVEKQQEVSDVSSPGSISANFSPLSGKPFASVVSENTSLKSASSIITASPASEKGQTVSPPVRSYGPSAAQAMAERLNQYEEIDRASRHADMAPLEEQDPGAFRQQLLSSRISSEGSTSLRLVHVGVGESFGVTVDEASRLALRDKPILIYGFEGPRKTMRADLAKRLDLQNLQTMNEYNANINIGFSQLNFTAHRRFLAEGFLAEGTTVNKKKTNVTEQESEIWKQFLVAHRSEFDFSGKLNTREERKRFLIKNYSHNNDLFEDDLKEALKNENWEIAARELGPAFQLLNEMSTTAPAVLDNTYRNTLSENQRIVLDQLIAYAFLRKTSKLGLEFAQEKGIPVLVVWKVPGEDHDDMASIRGLLAAKPYKSSPMQARRNSQGELSPEAITFSEMRHLGRLRQKMTTPIYVLISKMEVVPTKGPFSPQKKSSSQGSNSKKSSSSKK